MQIVTLTTDLGHDDHYVPILKGQLLQESRQIMLVDLTHHITPFDPFKAGEMMNICLPNFPEGTLHLVFVNPLNANTLPVIMAKIRGQYVIGSDNGMWGFLLREGMEAEWMVELKSDGKQDTDSFALLPYFRLGLRNLLNGNPRGTGTLVESYIEKIPFLPFAQGDSLSGYVTHVDHFGNVITNISRQEFENARKGRPFSIQYGSRNSIERISRHYEDTDMGYQLALFNSSGNLELAVNSGNASKLLGLKRHSKVVIIFD
jgi:S-adenosylmethionine hydrolase